MVSLDSPRQFAIEVVHKLQAAGFEAFFAGGCVRDQLMGLTPKDYDVATNARPDEIRQLFGTHRTLAIGEAFGVISVRGKRSAGQIDVATFRQDDVYSDGRHPDSIQFSTAEKDAQRRDFTINGLFYDPVTDRVLDFVGGQQDLLEKLIRAIGDPDQRIGEDRLRMLRAVRFAARLGFRIDPQTMEGIRRSAGSIHQISSERIANELRLMFGHPSRTAALDYLRDSTLLEQILPERTAGAAGGQERMARVRHAWSQIGDATFPVAMAVLVYDLSDRQSVIESASERWRLSNAETAEISWIASQIDDWMEADLRPWPDIQRKLVHAYAPQTLIAAKAIAQAWSKRDSGIEFCRQRLAWPPQELNPPPLINGDDLLGLQAISGPVVGRILHAVRDQQLSGKISDRQQALDYARTLLK